MIARVGVEAADRIGLAGPETHLVARGAIVIGVVAFAGIDARGVKERLVEGVDSEVAHEFGREDTE